VKCVRCGVTEDEHNFLNKAACHRFEEPAPTWLRALNAALEKVLR
jgi:hypothetical protein